MKQNGTLQKAMYDDLSSRKPQVLISTAPGFTFPDSCLKQEAFEVTEAEKIRIIAEHFREIMKTLGLNPEQDGLRDTPQRVAKMFVGEIFSGLSPANKPSITLFSNKYNYKQMLVEKNISVYSMCEHHFVPIIGKAHIAYISSGKIIGLSKINRIVKYYSQRPQIQERLTIDIANELSSLLGTEDVAVNIEATHLCVSARGIQDTNSGTVTAEYRGAFLEPATREEFLKYLH
jgi:GTP cyclohydrolase IA